jgi:hypothetical protein
MRRESFSARTGIFAATNVVVEGAGNIILQNPQAR